MANLANTSLETTPLSWGKSYLMCPPDYFGVFYEINPWMDQENRPDFELALEQWHNLVANLRRAGARVETIEPVKELPDMVFVANVGLVDGQRLILSKFRHAERQPESIYTSQWFQARGCEVAELVGEGDMYFERWGYNVCVSPVSEFLKAGGAVRCLTLPLDMTISKAD